jgi:ATP-dependent Clp protease ATP-binding subunit ClpC
MHTPTINQYGLDLTEQGRKGLLDPLIGREEQITRAVVVLGRRRKNNPVFVGLEGVGKTALAEGLAQRIATGDVPKRLRCKKIIAVQMSNLWN